MARLGVITDGISRDLERALQVMNEFGLKYAELQFLFGKEVGELNAQEIGKAKQLIDHHDVKVSSISRHNFAGESVFDVTVGDSWHKHQMEKLKCCIDTAHALNAPIVRIMSFTKQMILFGDNGAQDWVVSNGAWEKMLQLLLPAVELAEQEQITLAVETGNNAMITSAFLARKLIDDLGSQHLKVLWDPANSLYCHEMPEPDGLNSLEGGYLAHVHIKDIAVLISRARVSNRALNEGEMSPHLQAIADWLKKKNYQGAISLESVYRPKGGTFEDGFRSSIDAFQRIFA
ncbi:MAG: sugar phosphate isomerase/epimerase family protein [Arenicella sp.]